MATSPEMQQLSQELSQLTRALQNMVTASSRTAAAHQAQFEHLLDVNEQLSDYRKSLTQGKKLTKEQEKMAAEALRLKKKEIEEAVRLQKAQNLLTATLQKGNASATEIQKKQTDVARATKALNEAQNKSAAAGSSLSASLQSTNKSALIANAGLVIFGKALVAQGAQLMAQNAAAGGVIEGTGSVLDTLTSQQTQALKNFAVTGAQYAEITAKNRQMINSMGGSNVALGELEGTVKRFVIGAGGDFNEGLRLATEAATDFAQKGIKPTKGVMEAYTKDIAQLQMRTGMSIKDATAYFNDIASDADSIELLRRARKEERAGILANQRALTLHGQQLGMTAEQAKEAAKMLNKMAGAKPLDRLKQAAKIRALGGAMGVAGANEAADAIIAGPRATDDQKKARDAFMTSMANRLDEAKGAGIESELLATTLVDKLGLEEYLGSGNKFSTSLGDTLKPAFDNLAKAYTDVANTTEGKAAYEMAKVVAQSKILLNGDHYLGLLVTGVGAIAGMMLGGKALGLMGKVGGGVVDMGKNLIGMGGKGAAAAGEIAKPVSKLGKAASTAGKVLKGAGVVGAAADIGLGINDLAQGKAQKDMPSGMEAVSPMKWGMFIGDKINAGIEGAMGQSLGSKIYDVLNPSDEVSTKSMEATTAIKETSTKTADAVTSQVKKMDASNDLLTQIADMTKKQLELAEKQLVAMTMTETERTATATKTNLRAGNRFGSEYGYV